MEDFMSGLTNGAAKFTIYYFASPLSVYKVLVTFKMASLR